MSIIEKRDRSVEELQRLCRGPLRHKWEFFNPPGYVTRGWFAAAKHIFHLRCERCFTERHDAIGHSGVLLDRRYEYPEGYQMAADDRPTADELRAWLVKRNRYRARK